jgi:transcription initiation factor IIF auxiliary subunit
MEKLADGLQKLGEDDLLHVVTMVHDNKTSETYTKNDVESEYTSGERNKGHVLMNLQTASFTSTSTPSRIRSSRCSGTLRPRRLSYR